MNCPRCGKEFKTSGATPNDCFCRYRDLLKNIMDYPLTYGLEQFVTKELEDMVASAEKKGYAEGPLKGTEIIKQSAAYKNGYKKGAGGRIRSRNKRLSRPRRIFKETASVNGRKSKGATKCLTKQK